MLIDRLSGNLTQMDWIIRRAAGFFSAILALSMAGSILNLFPPLDWWHEINTSLGAYYLLIHLASLIVLLFAFRLKRTLRILLILILLALSFWYILPVLPYYREASSVPAEAGIKVLYSNLYLGNKNRDGIVSIIQRENPDVVALLETDESWIRDLNLSAQYPFKIEIPQSDCFGLALYSRLPFEGDPLVDLGMGIPPVIMQRIVLSGGQKATFVLVHTLPPLSRGNFLTDKLIIRRLSTLLRHSSGNFIVVGDFNATPFSFLYRRFVNWTGLRNVAWGRGLYRSWNAQNSFQRLTLDHLFIRGSLNVVSYDRLEDTGSDHFPFLVRIASE